MSADINSIKRKLLIKYPPFGNITANLDFKPSNEISTAGTDGKMVVYNPDFVNNLSDKEQIFLFAHELCHVALDHIYRSEGKDHKLWNIATDAVINALLHKEDGLPIIEGGVDIPEAVNYDAEEMYNMLLEEKQNQEQQENQGNNQQQSENNSKENQNRHNGDVGHDTHSLWEKAVEQRKKEQENNNNQNEQSKDENENGDTEQEKSGNDSEESQQEKSGNDSEAEKQSDFAAMGEKETFKQIKKQREEQLKKLSKELASESSHKAETDIPKEGRRLDNIGIAVPLIDWRKLLKQAVKYNEEWTRKNARMRNGYCRHTLQQNPMLETEILLDTSGSVSESLLRNFLRECKNVLANSKVKVGCFNTKFHGFTDLRRMEDIDNMSFPIGGGTDFNSAVEAFSGRVPNKIIFTDGKAGMPKKAIDAIWVVFGEQKINPKGGRVINISGEQLNRLQRYVKEYDLGEIK